ncbi:MAG: topoisomerase DNA-binding C4 zinc finger domain-containing protein [Lachnospiraceae bacterium]|nr:topoisomerase DNA-binding C4 zinc finger domain-containing protein [Lachnospiraceae bacterium]
MVRKTKKGRRYYGCEGYPECTYMSWTKPTANDKKKSDTVPEEEI